MNNKLNLNNGSSIFALIMMLNLMFFNVSASAEEYVLGPGDSISVNVYNESDLSISNVKIPKDGKISFPLIGDVKAAGKTLRSLKKTLIKKLKNGYLKKPQLVVAIENYRPFFVNGQVNSPGGYPYVEGLTVRKAIAIAGGLTERAAISKMSLVREGKKKPKKIRNQMDKSMGPGDILAIGESLF